MITAGFFFIVGWLSCSLWTRKKTQIKAMIHKVKDYLKNL